MTLAVTQWETRHGDVSIADTQIRQLFGGEKATDGEIKRFVEMCKAQRLNPFLGEAYLIKYREGAPASFVVGKDVFVQRAESHPDFDGMMAGVIVDTGDGKPSTTVGSFVMPGHSLVGGWARVYRRTWSHPVEKRVGRGEYDTGQSLWRSKPATMIEKVALVQALREAFPSDFVGLYDSSEMGVSPPSAPAPAPVVEPEPAAPVSGAAASIDYHEVDWEMMRRMTDEFGLTQADIADTMGVESATKGVIFECMRENNILTALAFVNWILDIRHEREKMTSLPHEPMEVADAVG